MKTLLNGSGTAQSAHWWTLSAKQRYDQTLKCP